MRRTLYEYQSYKEFLGDWIESQPNKGHGVKSKVAQTLKCQSAYLSQVLNGSAHLSAEQAILLKPLLGLSEEESHFWMLLVSYERAGSVELQSFIQKQMQTAIQKNLNLKNRVITQVELSPESMSRYYSRWYFAAVHVALSIPTLQTKEKLSQYFNLSLVTISEILDFLLSVGLAKLDSGKYLIGPSRIHLSDDTPLIGRHHSNWRIKSMGSMDLGDTNDLFYSSVVTLSKADITKIKSKLVQWITETKSIIRESKEEEVYSFNLDFFKVR